MNLLVLGAKLLRSDRWLPFNLWRSWTPHSESGNDWIALNQFESLFLMFFDVTSVTIATNYSTKWIQVNPNEVHRNGRARVQSKNQSCLQVRNTTCRRVDGIIAAAARGAQRCLPLFAYSASLQWLNMILIVPKCAECKGTTKEMDWGIAEAYHGGLRCSQGEKELKSQTSCSLSPLHLGIASPHRAWLSYSSPSSSSAWHRCWAIWPLVTTFARMF